ncbi:MAG TPA: hypothetical protein DCM28_23310 [Phycisphaerales bacterium]|nr:hypothetical protein [Phycisphaerales bacterium]HCD32048.1 hypothetical protein [Phycisphaerales bacterium]
MRHGGKNQTAWADGHVSLIDYDDIPVISADRFWQGFD